MLPDSYDESLFCTDGFTEISLFLCQVGAYFEQQFIEFAYSHPIKLKKPAQDICDDQCNVCRIPPFHHVCCLMDAPRTPCVLDLTAT